jgi:hypothetical protein
MTDVANEKDDLTGSQVRITRRTLANGRKGVAITITLDIEHLTDFAFIAGVAERISIEHNGTNSWVPRAILASALSNAAAYLQLPGAHYWGDRWHRMHPVFNSPTGERMNYVTVVNREDMETGVR